MNWTHRLCLTLMLAAAVVALSPVVTAWAKCPGPQVYMGGPVTNSAATRGSKDNPATDMNEAFNICQECSNGAYIYKYDTGQKKYVYVGRCAAKEEEPTGVLLAQPVVTASLGLLAVGLLAWGIYLRRRLKHVQTGG